MLKELLSRRSYSDIVHEGKCKGSHFAQKIGFSSERFVSNPKLIGQWIPHMYV